MCRLRRSRCSPGCAAKSRRARASRSNSIAAMPSKRPPTPCVNIIRNGIAAPADGRTGEQAVKIHEYQGKEILRRFGVPTPRGIPAFSVDEAVKAAETLGCSVCVVKAQIHAGGRGKGGGVKVARSIAEVRDLAGAILGMQLVTHQTGPQGQKVRRLLIEEGADIRTELYVGMVVDRATQRVVLMASSEGGMDIEEVAAKTPEKIHRVVIDPLRGLTAAEADDVARKIGIPEASSSGARSVLLGLYRAFDESDA